MYKSYKYVLSNFKLKKPDIVISSGGFVSLPVLFACKRLNIKYYLLEENVVFGYTTKLFKRSASGVFLSFDAFKKKDNMFYTGNPITNYKLNPLMYSTNEQKTNILIIGGSLGSSVLCDIAVRLSNILNDNYNIILVCGKYYYKYYSFQKNNFIMYEFLDDIYNMIYKCDIIISRCGSATISEIVSLNKRFIAIPSLNTSKNHQVKNALFINSLGLCDVVYENDINYTDLTNLIVKGGNYKEFLKLDSAGLIVSKIGDLSGFY